MKSHAFVAAARRLPMTRLAIRAFIEEARDENHPAAVETALEASNERAANVLAIAGASIGRELNDATIRRVLPWVEDIRSPSRSLRPVRTTRSRCSSTSRPEAPSHARESDILRARGSS